MLRTFLESVEKNVPKAPLTALGLGVLLAWVATMQLLAREASGIVYGRSVLVYDMGSLVVFLLVFAAAKRLTPLAEKKAALVVGAALMVAGALCEVAAFLLPAHAQLMAQAGLALAGCGSALAILLWWEAYAALDHLTVAFLCAGSWIVREAVIVVLAGYSISYLLASAVVLPFVAAGLFWSYRASVGGTTQAPPAQHASSPVPWKPMVLVALYAFAYGCGTWILFYQDSLAMHLGMLLPALVVCASVLLARKYFNFTVVYRVILPAAIAGFLALLFVQGLGTEVATFFVRSSYTAVLIYVSVLLCNLARRYHINAPWLFSLFNIVHIAFVGLGTVLYNALPAPAIVGACIVCIVFATFIMLSEPSFDSDWKVIFIDKTSDDTEPARLQFSVESLGRHFGLSERQREILLFLARGETPRSIGHALSISSGTVKAHVQHIYKKLGIHSRNELDALVNRSTSKHHGL